MSSFFPPKTPWPRNFMYFHCLFSKFRGVKSEYVSPPRVLCFMEQTTFTEEPVPKCLAEKQVTSAVLLRSPWLFSIITSRHPTQLNVFKHVRFCGPRWFFSDTCTATIVNPKNPSFFWINHFCRKFVSSPVCRWLRFSLMRVRQQAT